MKPLFAILSLGMLTACVAPDVPVEAFEAANPAIAEQACRSAAAKEGLTVRQITAFREVADTNGPSGLSAFMTLSGATEGEARCTFAYATGKATISVL
jgi:hypothetical protein